MAPLSPKHIANIERENTKTQSVCSQVPHTHTHDSSPHFLCGWSNTTSSQISMHLAVIVLPLAQVATWLHLPCYLNCKGLTFDLLTHPPKHLMGIKGHTDRGHTHLLSRTVRVPQGQSIAPQCHAQPETKKNSNNVSTQNAHRHWDTPTSLIKHNWPFFFKCVR